MVKDLNVAFWNVHNLYDLEVSGKGAAGVELEERIQAIADTLNELFDGNGADLIGLAECNTEDILIRIKDKLRWEYSFLFEPCADPQWTGLSVLARVARVGYIQKEKDYSLSSGMMPRWFVVKCELQPGEGCIYFVVNHWPSRRGTNSEIDRMTVGGKLNSWLKNNASHECVIVVGDFNAEPFEKPMTEALKGIRYFGAKLHQGEGYFLYNACWRFLHEADFYENTRVSGYVSPHPITSLFPSGDEPVIFDQILVSWGALRVGPVLLKESSVKYHHDGRISASEGHHPVPKKWDRWKKTGASDHFPITAVFTYRLPPYS